MRKRWIHHRGAEKTGSRKRKAKVVGVGTRRGWKVEGPTAYRVAQLRPGTKVV